MSVPYNDDLDETSPWWRNVKPSADELQQLTRSLRQLGVIAVMLTVTTLALVIVLTLIAYVYFPYPESTYERNMRALFLAPPGISALLALLSAILFDARRRRGNALHEEVAEEVQYRLQDLDRIGVSPEEMRPPFWLRWSIRNFALASQLPVIPGKGGPAVIAAINSGLMLIAVALLTR